MKSKELKELILNGESSTLEFKRKISSESKIAKEISAFANTIGGVLLIGVDDDGTIYGVESEKSESDQIEKICNFYIEPPVQYYFEMISVNGKYVAYIKIPRSNLRPHKVVTDNEAENNYGQAYIRVGEKSLAASREMTRVLAAQNINSPPLTLSIGDKERRLFTYLERSERATVKDFANLVNISRRRAEQLLVRLVRAGVVQIHVDSGADYFTLVDKV